MAAGFNGICGVDEAGRGPLAGPVLVCALILDQKNIPPGLDDSKKLSARKRQNLFEQILVSASFCVVSAPPDVIARLNIRGATLWAMAGAVRALCPRPDLALIDGRDVPENLPCPGEAVIGGDGRSLSIAAASIVAKVVRDRMCETMHAEVPEYGFAAHKGYGTKRHLEALVRLGPCQFHRKDFAPVARLLG